jgi:hypothetical protein
MRLEKRQIITKVLPAVILLAAIIGYSFFQARDFIRGPYLVIDEPQNGSLVEHPLVTVNGKALNISSLSLNGRSIAVDEDGNFNETLVLARGYTIMTLEARDRFGRVETKTLELIHK